MRIFAVLLMIMLLVPAAVAQEEAPAAAPAEAAPQPEAPPPPPPVALEGDEARRNVVNPLQGQPAPALAVASWVNTEGVNWEGLKGQVVLLDFWGVWCEPCRTATPKLKALYEANKDKGFAIVGIHTVSMADQAPGYITQQEIPYIIGFDNADQTAAAYKVDTYPDLYLVDHTGVVRYADVASADWANIENAVNQLVAERAKAMAPAEPAPAPAEPAPAPAEPAPAPAEPAPAEGQ